MPLYLDLSHVPLVGGNARGLMREATTSICARQGWERDVRGVLPLLPLKRLSCKARALTQTHARSHGYTHTYAHIINVDHVVVDAKVVDVVDVVVGVVASAIVVVVATNVADVVDVVVAADATVAVGVATQSAYGAYSYSAIASVAVIA